MAKVKISRATLNLSSLAISEDVQIKGVGQLSIPVSVFRRADLFSTKTRQIKKGVAKDAVALVSQAYQTALVGVANSLGPKTSPPVQGSMVWPGPNSRSKPSKVEMLTSGGPSLPGDPQPDTDLVFKGYTSATLRRYYLSRQYEFLVEGFRTYDRENLLRNRGIPAHASRVSRRNDKRAFSARRDTAPGKTNKWITTLIGPGSKGQSAAADIALAGPLKSQKISKAGHLPNRFRTRKVKGTDTRQVIVLSTLTGKIGGFGKAVAPFAEKEALFLLPFLTGDVPEMNRNITFFTGEGPRQATAVFTKNELERPYVRRFMAAMHRVMIRHVADRIGKR